MILFLINFEFKFNLSLFLAFFTGVIVGIILTFLIYTIICLLSLRKKEKRIENYNNSVTEEEINQIIKNRQKEFLILRKKETTYQALKETIILLVNEIATKYSIDSKHPIAELTLEELILLDKYILGKIEGLLSRKGLSLLKKLKLSTILNIIDTNTKIKNNKAIKASKKMHLSSIAKGSITLLNLLNPFHWFKKLLVSPTLNFLIKKVFLLSISIIGEETYNVYSKKVFVSEEDTSKLIEELEKENEGIITEEEIV